MASPVRTAIHLASYYGLRPLARVVPLRAIDAVAAVCLAPVALAAALLGGQRARAYLALVGASSSFGSLLRFSYRDLRERLRATYFFVDPRREERHVHGSHAAQVGIQLTTLHAGMRYLGAWVKRHEGRIVYIADPLELAGGAGGVAPSDKWPYFTHGEHHAAFGSHHVAPGGAFKRLAPVLSDGRPIFLCQEAVWFPVGDREPNATLFGVPVRWPIGARKLSERTGAPIVFTEVRIQHGRWQFVQDGPLTFEDDEALRRYMEQRLRERPWAWTYWRVFMDEYAAQGRESSAVSQQGIQADPAASPIA
ncbi:MAG: hypothetical protein AAF624_01950 [Bacteroidota bacterium]